MKKELVDEKVTRHDGSQEKAPSPLAGEGWGEGFPNNDKYEPRPCICSSLRSHNCFPARKGWGLRGDNSQSLINVKGLARASRGRALSSKMTKSLQTTSADPFNASEQDFAYSLICLFTFINHFTHFTHLTHFRKRIAFTLAEVLVTLAVIGVVAAMTIPTILNKYQEHVTIQKYKKVYSLLSNALLQQYANNGAYYECYNATISDCVAMYEDMKHILKTSKICDDNAYKKGCIPDYKGFDTIQKEQNLYPDEPGWANKNYIGWVESYIKGASKPAWVLSDGTIIMFYLPNWGFKYIVVDLNGMQGPNKWGYDLFDFTLRNNGRGALVFSPAISLIEKGGITPAELHKKAGF